MTVVSGEGLQGLFSYPTLLHVLGQLGARDKWYHESHKRRWERRFGRSYPFSCGKRGTFSGIRWHNG